jgi:hypothetical protein
LPLPHVAPQLAPILLEIAAVVASIAKVLAQLAPIPPGFRALGRRGAEAERHHHTRYRQDRQGLHRVSPAIES